MLDDISNLIKFAVNIDRDFDEVSTGFIKSQNTRNSSIDRKARDSIFQFPVLVSESLSLDTLMLMNSALEDKYCNYLEMILNNFDIVDLRKNENKLTFLKNIHQNDYKFYGSQDPLKTSIGKYVDGSVGNEMKTESVKLIGPYKENFNYKSLNTGNEVLNEADPIKTKAYSDNTFLVDDEIFKKNMTSSDFKKTNELQPKPIKTSILYRVDNNLVKSELLLGVKTISHPLRVDDVVNFIPRSIKEENILFKTIQWTTGEISFFKDLVLNADSLKFDAKVKDGATKWWVHLKNKSKFAKFRALFNRDEFIPNAAMVFNITEMEYIKNHNGLDLMDKDANKVSKLMGVYFLIGVYVIDEVNEICYVYEDDMESWNPLPFSSLKKIGNKTTNIFVDLKNA